MASFGLVFVATGFGLLSLDNRSIRRFPKEKLPTYSTDKDGQSHGRVGQRRRLDSWLGCVDRIGPRPSVNRPETAIRGDTRRHVNRRGRHSPLATDTVLNYTGYYYLRPAPSIAYLKLHSERVLAISSPFLFFLFSFCFVSLSDSFREFLLAEFVI